jgi:hypothetical protein
LIGFPQDLPELTSFNLCGFRSFEGIATSLPKLARMELYDYPGEDFAFFPTHVPSLKEIRKDHYTDGTYEFSNLRSLKGFPPTLPALEVLNLQGNKFETLEGIPQHLPALRCLYLQKNGLRSIADFPTDVPNLEEVELIENELSSLRGLAPSYPKLKQLGLSVNQLTDLTELPDAPLLEGLTLDQNRLKSLRGLRPQYPQLIFLGLNNNKLESLEHFPQVLPALEYLDLSSNSLTRLQGLPSSLPKLQYFHIGHNPLRTLSFVSLEELRIIQDHPSSSHGLALSDHGLELLKHGTPEALYEYYRKTPPELADELIQTGRLTQQEEERLIHEANWQERQVLEAHFPPDHPILRALQARNSMQIPTTAQTLLL